MDNQSSGPKNHCATVPLGHDFHATFPVSTHELKGTKCPTV